MPTSPQLPARHSPHRRLALKATAAVALLFLGSSIALAWAAARGVSLGTIGLLLGVASLLAIAVTLRFAQGLRRRLDQLRSAAVDLAAGRLDRQVVDGGDDEVGHLATAFNQMASRMRETMGAKDAMLNDLETAQLEHRRLTMTLEETVRARTALLEAKTRELLESVEQLQSAKAHMAVADRLASVGMLAAGVAHEINNPLSFIISNLEYVLKECERPAFSPGELPELTQALRDALNGAKRVSGIVRDLRRVSRVQSVSIREIDVGEVVDSALKVASNQLRYKARVVRELGEVPRVFINEGQLGQVVLNLLINAGQAIPEGQAAEHEIRVRTFVDDAGQVVIEVKDTGCGIAPEVRGKIFDPFFTTKPVGVGTGLGLSICNRLVVQHGGHVTVDSEVGKGSTFRVVLPPSHESDVPMPGPSDGHGVEAVAGLRMLVVDDEPAFSQSLRRVLGRDLTVVTAPSGAQALALLETGEKYDVLLIDVMMPGMTGIELYEQIGLKWPELARRVLFVSGGVFSDEARDFLEHSTRWRLEKPVSGDQLRRTVGELVALLRPRVPSGP